MPDEGLERFRIDRQTVIDPPDSYVSGTVTRTYRLDGLLATQSFPSSITESLGYDAIKRPTRSGSARQPRSANRLTAPAG
jgi:hypothetical protein